MPFDISSMRVITTLKDPADATAARDLARADAAEAASEERGAAAALVLARDDLVAARAQAALRQQALTRQEDIRTRGIGSDAAVEGAALALSAAEQAVLSRRQAVAEAEARVDLAATGLDRMRINLADAERALAETSLVAPFDGVLGEVSVVRGRMLSANERVADLIDPATLEVSAQVSTTQHARMTGPDWARRTTSAAPSRVRGSSARPRRCSPGCSRRPSG